jgi:hypothetical protein
VRPYSTLPLLEERVSDVLHFVVFEAVAGTHGLDPKIAGQCLLKHDNLTADHGHQGAP